MSDSEVEIKISKKTGKLKKILTTSRDSSVENKTNENGENEKIVLKKTKIVIVSSSDSEEESEQKSSMNPEKIEKYIEKQRKKLSTMTVKQLQKYANEKDMKIPLLLKEEYMNYILATLEERKNGVYANLEHEIKLKDLKEVKCDLEKYEVEAAYFDKEPWIVHLHREGWCSIPLDDFNLKKTKKEFFSWLKSCSDNFDPHDKSTWKEENIPNTTYGILKEKFGHTKFQWRTRLLCAKYFAKIWECDEKDLLCSFDGGHFRISMKRITGSIKSRFHCDYNRIGNGKITEIQGLVTMTDFNRENGSIAFLEHSHLKYIDYLNRHKTAGLSWKLTDIEDKTLRDCRKIILNVPAGHLVLWDSRLVHSGIPPEATGGGKAEPKYRMCLYVSMGPRSGATESELDKRIKLYSEDKMTNHNVYGPWLKQTAPPMWRRGMPVNHPRGQKKHKVDSELMARLIGYNSFEEANDSIDLID